MWAIETQNREPVLAAAPMLIGQWVSQAPVREPDLPPIRPVPPPPTVVKLRPAPVPPATPRAPPSQLAVTALPAEAPSETASKVQAPAPAPVPVAVPSSPAPAAPAEPVIAPRSDAAHLNNPAPVYPAASRRLREHGRVLFDVYILPDGSVGEIKLKRSSGFARLDETALEAVRQWRYVPAKRGDQPIPYWYVQPIDFAMHSL